MIQVMTMEDAVQRGQSRGHDSPTVSYIPSAQPGRTEERRSNETPSRSSNFSNGSTYTENTNLSDEAAKTSTSKVAFNNHSNTGSLHLNKDSNDRPKMSSLDFGPFESDDYDSSLNNLPSRYRTNTYSHTLSSTLKDFENLNLQKGSESARKNPLNSAAALGIRFDTERVKFDHVSPPGFGRRRSKSQGNIYPGRSLYEDDLLGDMDDLFSSRQENGSNDISKFLSRELLLKQSNDSDLNEMYEGDFSSRVVGSRKWASSFHAFENDPRELPKEAIHLDENSPGAIGSSIGRLDIPSGISQRTRARLGLSSDLHDVPGGFRDRAESDMGRYTEYQPEREPILQPRADLSGTFERGSPSLKTTPLRSFDGYENQLSNQLQSTMESVSQLNQINQQLLSMYANPNFNGLQGMNNMSHINTADNVPPMYGMSGMNNATLLSPSKQNKQAAGSNKGDWVCLACGNTNYSWRHVCNMRKCRAPKPGHLSMEPTPPGSWACLSCGNLNYAERMVCNMRKCRAPRPVAINTNTAVSTLPSIHAFQSQQLSMGLSPKHQYLLAGHGQGMNHLDLGAVSGGYSGYSHGYNELQTQRSFDSSSGISEFDKYQQQQQQQQQTHYHNTGLSM